MGVDVAGFKAGGFGTVEVGFDLRLVIDQIAVVVLFNCRFRPESLGATTTKTKKNSKWDFDLLKEYQEYCHLIQLLRDNMSPISPMSPWFLDAIVPTPTSGVEDQMMVWTPTTPITRPSAPNFDDSTSELKRDSPVPFCNRESLAYKEVSELTNDVREDYCSRNSADAHTYRLELLSGVNRANSTSSPKALDGLPIFSPTIEGQPRQISEELLMSSIAGRVIRLPLRINTGSKSFKSSESSRRKRSWRMLESPRPISRNVQRETESIQTRRARSRSTCQNSDNIEPRTRSSSNRRISRRLRTPSTDKSQASRISEPKPKTLSLLEPSRPHPLLHSLSHLQTPLIPLISVITGLSHPAFPRTLLQYHLLTHDQLDSLARWYHQTIDAGPEGTKYPATIAGRWCYSSTSTKGISLPNVSLDAKRRRFGRFIGLRGCESPVVDTRFSNGGSELGVESRSVDKDEEMTTRTPRTPEEDITAKMEREWKKAMRQAEEERKTLEKMWRGRF